MHASVKYWVWLSTILEPPIAHQICNYFTSPVEAYMADPERYDLIPGLTQQQRDLLRYGDLSQAEEILDDCVRKDIRIITWQDADYPERLRNIYAPPLVFYARGKYCHFDEEAAIAMAGTRKASFYGQQMAYNIAHEITTLGGLVVTGVVNGCDHSAAVGALRAGGPLVCVLAGGVDVPYYESLSGREFLEDVAAHGTLVSLSPPGTPHLGNLFQARNQFLTGLTLGVICVEAGRRSGTLQVANMALDNSRSVYAVPANVGTPSAAGTNELLRQGLAAPVLRGRHVLEDFATQFPLRLDGAVSFPPPRPSAKKALKTTLQPEQPLQPEEEKKVDTGNAPVYIDLEAQKNQFTDDEIALLTALQQGRKSMDDLIAETGIPAQRATATASLLMLRGYIENPSGSYFALSDPSAI